MASLKKDCGAKNYKGTRPPMCAGGVGCQKCWNIHYARQTSKKRKPGVDRANVTSMPGLNRIL